MKTKLLLTSLLSFVFYLLSSQVPQGFNYQAIARDGSGNPIVGATIKVKLSILKDTLGFYAGGGDYVWEEEHLNVLTNAYGLFNVVLGDPAAGKVQGVASFSVIDWNQPKLYIGTKIANPSTYKVLGGAKLWSVPYSLVAGELGGTVDKIKVKGTETEPDSALFEVRNRNGQIVFAVYNEGVRVYVDDGVKGNTKGGFAIGGFGTDKGTSQNYLMVSRDSIRAYVNDTISKGVTKGGFAIGGFGTAKGKPQDYFRVTRDSTRVYVYDDGTKGNTKGGFAIGGFDNTKGLTQKLMTVSKDSIRLYIDDTNAKGVTKGGFAIGGFDVGKGDGASFFNVFPDSTGRISPAQNRLLWYPLKNAFLTGKILVEKKDSVGENSFSSGYLSKAKGKYSQALGYQAIARGDYSTAIGKNAIASAVGSFAFGENVASSGINSFSSGKDSKASASGSYAFGVSSNSTGVNSFALGNSVTASGSSSFALGNSTTSSGLGSFVSGVSSTASGNYSTAFGRSCTAKGEYSSAMGYLAYADDQGVTAIGYNAKGYGINSVSIGTSTIAGTAPPTSKWGYATALGNQAQATGDYSVSIGDNTFASGDNSVAVGSFSNASGWFSSAFGYHGNAQAMLSNVIGYGTATGNHPNSSTVWWDDDPVFVIGNGKNSSSNAVTVLKNGNAGFGTITPSEKLEFGGTNSKIYLNSATSNMIRFNTSGVAAPAFTTQSAGTKIVLYPGITSSTVDFALGIESSTIWLSVPSNTCAFKFYAGTTELMKIGGTGNVGIGTTSPSQKLDVEGIIRANYLTIDPQDGVSEGGELFLSGAGAYPGVAIDNLAGNVRMHTFSSGKYLQLIGGTIRAEGTGGSNYFAGNVGIGTASPGAKLEVSGSEATPQAAAIQNTRANYPQLIFNATSGAANAKIWRIIGRSANYFEIQTLDDSYGGEVTAIQINRSGTSISNVLFPNGRVGIGISAPSHILHINGIGRSTSATWATSSDMRVKNNIKDIENGLEKILKLNPVSFQYSSEYVNQNPGYKGNYLGFLAQEVRNILPELVSETSEKIGDKTINDFLLLNQGELIPVMVKAIKEQQQQIEILKEKNIFLEAKSKEIDELKSRLQQIEAMLSKTGVK
jgi:hypothetical protein